MRTEITNFYLKHCVHFNHEPEQAECDKWVAQCAALAASAIGTEKRVSLRNKGLASKVVVTGRVATVEPDHLRFTGRASIVIWKVTFESGRSFNLRRI